MMSDVAWYEGILTEQSPVAPLTMRCHETELH